MAVRDYRQILNARFGGVLSRGKHAPDGVACALEVASIARGLEWTDDPRKTGLPDLRPLNDARWSSDAARTAALVPVVEALWDWAAWSRARKQTWAAHVAIATVRDLVSQVVPEPHASRCRAVTTLDEASSAAADSASAAAYAAAAAAYAASAAARAASAADSASAAARAAAAADSASAATAAAYAADVAAAAYAAAAARAADSILQRACQIWIEAAEATR